MTSKMANRHRREARRALGRLGLGPILMGLVLLLAALPGLAANSLKDIRHRAGSGGTVDVILEFAEPVGPIQTFTTDDPPRIALDLLDTSNASGQRRHMVGTGATSAVSAVESGGRTRIVIDLLRTAKFETRAEGNQLVISIAGSGRVAGASAVTPNMADPSKRTPTSLALANIDFRRTPEGAGQLVLTFTGEGAVTDLRNEKDRLVVELPNAQLPQNLRRKLDVSDFATPVRSIEPGMSAVGAQLVLNASGAFESMAYQTGSEYVVEVSPRREAADAKLGVPAKPTYSGKPVTFNFQDIPVRTVLQLIAEESSLNVVAADSVQGNVTLRLINVPWDQALDIVLRAKQLDKRQEANVIWIGPQSELAAFEQQLADARIALEQRAELISEFIPINYGNAEDIAKLLTDESLSNEEGGGGGGIGGGQRGFLSPRGSLTFDTRTNTLLLNDIPQKIDEIKALVAVLDRAVDQVLIEARIVIANENFSREIGARFGFAGNQGDGDPNVIDTSGSLEANSLNNNSRVDAEAQNAELLNQFQIDRQTDPNTPFPVLVGPTITRALNVNLPATDPLAGKFALSILGANYLIDLELSALQSEGRGEVVANPRVITANQQEAIIKQGDEVGFTTLQQSGSGTGQFTVEFKEVLLELKVTPTITQDNRVFLKLSVKKDEVSGFVTTPLFSIPQLTKRELNTAVLVENGQTVMLGGVYEFKNQNDLQKIPFLGDIPGVGVFFRNRLKSNQKAELLLFVTPRILRLDQLR